MSRVHLFLLGGAALLCAAASAASAQSPTLSRFQVTASRPAAIVLVYTDGPALVGVEDEKLAIHTDTLRLRTPQRLVADLSNGDVHLVAEDGGSLAVSAKSSDARPVAAAGRHIILARGGAGIRASDIR